jgi:GNAT superfamily N-acetyltransferase
VDHPLIARWYLPGAIGRIVELHGVYYASAWGFGAFFEAKVARELADFITRFDTKRDGIWTVDVEGRIGGSIAIDGSGAGDGGAHLRWFILDERLRGRGIGARLLAEAVDFCRGTGQKRVSLWTFAGLDAARRLYELAGFRLVEERRGRQWGVEVTEQRFELALPGDALPDRRGEPA